MFTVESENLGAKQVQDMPAFTQVNSLETPTAVYAVGKIIKFWDMSDRLTNSQFAIRNSQLSTCTISYEIKY